MPLPPGLENPFHKGLPPSVTNQEALNALSPGLGDAMQEVLGAEREDAIPLPPEDLLDQTGIIPDNEPLPSLELDPREKALEAAMQEAEGIFNHETPEGKIEHHFFGPKQIEQAFGFEPSIYEIPDIPYTREELIQAESQGYELILRVAKDNYNRPMTAFHIYHLLKDKHGGGENSWGETFKVNGADAKIIFHDPDQEWDPTDPANEGKKDPRAWFIQTHEDFFYKETPTLEWKLEARAVLPDSENKNYIEQTRLLRDTLKQQGALTPEEEAECSDQKLQELTALMVEDWQEAAKQLANLLVNQNHRRSFPEAFYGQFMRQAVGGTEFKNSFIDQHVYDRTRSHRSDGCPVSFGFVHHRGMVVSWGGPREAHEGLYFLPTR